MRNKQNKTLKKLKRTHKVLCEFFKTTNKNYVTMKLKIAKIWASCICLLIMISAVSCNVTRTIKTESSYYQKGDTTCTITVKTVETYDATKKGM